MTPAKLDFKKQFPELYRPSSKNVEIVDVPPMKFFMIDGKGNPNTSEIYKKSIQALYGLSYNLKMNFKKKSTGRDYVVPPLEGLWYVDDMENWSANKKDEWKWAMMIRIPDFIPREDIDDTFSKINEKKPELKEFLEKVSVEDYNEGESAQILYFGPYSDEGPTIKRIHEKIKYEGKELRGKHHEIYLNDPRKVKPERLKTIIRQPFK